MPGSRSIFGEPIKQAVLKSSSPGPCTIISGQEHVSLMDAIYIHSALANTIELDSMIFLGHVGQSAVTVPLAVGEMTSATSKDILVAMVAACEVAGRMGGYFAIGPQQGHMRSYLHRVAGATAAARLLNLSQKKITKALAIALSMPEFPLFPAAFSPDTKVLCTSSPAVEGTRAAFLAAEGIDAAIDIMEHPAGFRAYFSHLEAMPDVWRQLGNTWALEALSAKMYPACAYAQGPVEAAASIVRSRSIHNDEIDRILIEAPLTTLTMEFLSAPHPGAGVSPVNTNFSTRRSVAACLIAGNLNSDFFQKEIFNQHREGIESLLPKISMKHSWQQSVELIKGIDQALENPGEPGVFGMSQTRKTFEKFKDSIGSKSMIGVKDFPDIMKLPVRSRNYLIRRFWKSFRQKLPVVGQWGGTHQSSFEKDLSKFELRQAGKVTIWLKDGEEISSRSDLPRGFAGHHRRDKDIQDKFVCEAQAVIGSERALQALKIVTMLPNGSIKRLLEVLSTR